MVPMRFGPPEYRGEYWVPAESCGFAGFVFVQVTLTRTDFDGNYDTRADVREARGVVETRAGIDPVTWDGEQVPEGIARDAEKKAIAECCADYEREVELMHADLAVLEGAA